MLIREENIPRLKWPLGVVTELFPGKDGIVRSVLLRTARGSLTTPIQLYQDLEINDKTGGCEETFPSSVECIDSNKVKVDKLEEVVQPTQRVKRSGRIVKPKIIFDT